MKELCHKSYSIPSYHMRVQLIFGYCLVGLLAIGVIQADEKKQDFTQQVNAVSFVMKYIPSGSFMMGCGVLDQPCYAGDSTLHFSAAQQQWKQVNGFYLAETETTWDLYQICITEKACPDNRAHGGDNGWGKGSRPIIEVSWLDVNQYFLPWLNKKTQKSYRLPFEYEWEYAARAGTNSRFSWGNTISCVQAHYGFSGDECENRASTQKTKSYQPNAFGLYDMHGNVWEMVQDCWQLTPHFFPSDKPSGACEEIVLRGGSWLNTGDYLASAVRYRHNKTYRESGDGFRLALSVSN
ncbi:formylglycine-generating enzyme family protein [Marinicella sp. W31]|uniref:formylglycine-generating enzyme family protein n=1 Tax=Marinicella sp. W31 TaxID=3023713 RepID=UPI00375812D7